MYILSMDPGVTNFAHCILQYDPDSKKKPSVVASGMFRGISDLKEEPLQASLRAFRIDSDKLINQFKSLPNFTIATDVCIAERFMPRFRGMGNVAEIIGMELGSFAERSKELELLLVMAVTWKNWFRRHYNIDKKDKLDTSLLLYGKSVSKSNEVDHISDSICIGIYYLEHLYNLPGKLLPKLKL